MNTNILIAGGSGLVGSQLTKILQESGYQVSHLSRNPQKSKLPAFYWNPDKGEIDLACLNDTDCIINLAGSGVADARWTESYKNDILNSRVNSTRLIARILKENVNKVNLLMNASAVGIYGNEAPLLTQENAPAGSTFLAEVCRIWEEEAMKIQSKNIRVVIFRIGLVLSAKGGFLKAIATPAKFGFASYFGDGAMMNPWIHIDVLCSMFLHDIKNNGVKGIYNAVAPNPETNKALVQLTAKALNRPQFLPGVPAFLLNLMMGEMGPMLLANQNISAERISNSGFEFGYPRAKKAIENLLV
jgi:uncharacterized protein (TIGR01777 family)